MTFWKIYIHHLCNAFLTTGFHVEVGYITIKRSDNTSPRKLFICCFICIYKYTVFLQAEVLASAPRDEHHTGSVKVWSNAHERELREVTVSGDEVPSSSILHCCLIG